MQRLAIRPPQKENERKRKKERKQKIKKRNRRIKSKDYSRKRNTRCVQVITYREKTDNDDK
jgi:hypothetical protein